MTSPAVFTGSRGGQSVTVTLTPLGFTELEFRLSLNGVEVPQDTATAKFDSITARDEAFADTVALYESHGYTRVA